MKKYILIAITILLAASNHLLAVSVVNYTIAPLNRVTIYFDKMPATIEDSLSEDKHTLYINLGDVDFNPTQQFVIGEGIIKKIELIKKNKNTHLIISLTDKRGFTIAKLPYSVGLIVEFFDWKKLDSAEESYRLGLLSLIDNYVEIAEPDLLKGTNGGIGDASFFLGSIHLNRGKINTALKLFHFADVKKTTINDNYAALSQIYNYKKQEPEAEKYANVYKNKTGFNSVPSILFPKIIETGDQADLLPIIDSILNTKQDLVDSMPDDTTEIDTNKTEINDTTKTQKDESIWEAEKFLLTKYAIGIAIALILFVVYLYLKWRNKQLRAIQEQQAKTNKQTQNIPPQKENFNKIMEEKIKATNTVPPKIEKKVPNPPPAKQPNNVKQKQVIKPPASKIDYSKNADELLNLIDKIKNEEEVITSDSILKAELHASNLNATKTHKPINKIHNPNIDLASRLLQEQKKIKQEKLSNLSNIEKLTPDKINEIAKKIGIDKGSLETKSNLDNLLKNESELNKLREKFGIKS